MEQQRNKEIKMINGWPYELTTVTPWGSKGYRQLMWFKCIKCGDFIDHGCECDKKEEC